MITEIVYEGAVQDNMEINEKRYYHIFPFGKVLGGSEIIIWGAGEVGREYVQQLERTGYCRLKYIVDSNWEHMAGSERAVFPPEKIAEEKGPVIVIANANVKTAMEITERIEKLCLGADIIYEDLMCDIPEINNGKNAFSQLVDSVNFIKKQSNLLKLIPTIAPSIVPLINRAISLMNREIVSIESSLKYLNSDKDYRGKWETYCQEVRGLLRIYGVDEYQLVRVGEKHDGGYIMLDDFARVQLAYSFGISDNVSWDKDIADRGIDVFLYDHTIEDLPVQNERFHFFRKGIAEIDRPDDQLYSLRTFICKNNHEKEKNIILKMDIEGAEWNILDKMESDLLNMFGQIVLELHNMTIMDDASKIKNVLNKLNATHAVVHVHGNNWSAALSYGQGILPSSLEVTYVNREMYCIKEMDDVELPILIDERNCCERDEFYLGKWNQI